MVEIVTLEKDCGRSGGVGEQQLKEFLPCIIFFDNSMRFLIKIIKNFHVPPPHLTTSHSTFNDNDAIIYAHKNLLGK